MTPVYLAGELYGYLKVQLSSGAQSWSFTTMDTDLSRSWGDEGDMPVAQRHDLEISDMRAHLKISEHETLSAGSLAIEQKVAHFRHTYRIPEDARVQRDKDVASMGYNFTFRWRAVDLGEDMDLAEILFDQDFFEAA